jgi:molybdate transport system permease protein
VNYAALWLTCKLAVLVSVFLLVIGLPLAYWLATTRSRWRIVVEAATALPLVLPPTVIGFYMLLLFGSKGPLAAWFHLPLAFTFEGLVLASMVYNLPFAVQPFAAGFRALDPRLLWTAYTLGDGRWRAFVRVALPVSIPSILTGLILTFAHTVGEFGVVLMVGGNLPGVTRTASIDIYDNVQALEYAAANRMSLLLTVVSFVVLCFIYARNRALNIWDTRA